MAAAPTASSVTPGTGTPPRGRPLLILALVLLVVLGFLFRASFNPDQAMFANDGPLGLMKSRVYQMPDALRAVWIDLNWLGGDGGNVAPGFSALSLLALGPLGSNKFFAALAILALGCSAGLFVRQLRFHPFVCVAAGIAAALNTDFFSYACWGLGSLTICVASVFLALAALVSTRLPVWLRVVLAGAALGHSLTEGFDNGAIFSLYVAAFAVAWNWFTEPKLPPGKRLLRGALSTAGVALASALVAAHVLISLVQANITGVVGMGQDRESTSARWTFATQWSLPPKETLRAIIPGLYGYRMDTEGGGKYWGTVGSHPEWDDYFASAAHDPSKQPRRELRFSGAGHYAGVLVVLVAAFAVVQSLRTTGGVFQPVERRWVWFWAVAAFLSLLFAFGRFAPFYRLIYALPYFNTIRNPVKFLHPFNFALVVLFAYGLEALWRGWVTKPVARPGGLREAIQTWWSQAPSIDRRWALATIVLTGVAFIAWLIYGSSRASLVQHLTELGFPDAKEAAAIARFSHQEVGLFAVVLAGSVLLVLAALSGWLSGGRAKLAALAFGAWLTLDLARANAPWIIHYNWKERYASNPLFDALRRVPQESRMTGQMPFSIPGEAGKLQRTLEAVYKTEWLQYQFRFFDIQSLDIVQMPRTPADFAAHYEALQGNPLRNWELCSTRYLLTLAPLVDIMNQQLDAAQKRFRLHTAFNLSQSSSGVIQVETNTTGPFALVEFTGALPRAMLFDQWRSSQGDTDVLRTLASTNFNPHAEVLIAEQIPAPSVTTSSQPAGTASYRDYSPKQFTIDTDARTPCVLLVNDRYDNRWTVTVDGKEDTLLRANFVTRGVYLPAGKHEVRFRFAPPAGAMSFSAGMFALALGLWGYAALGMRQPRD